MSEAIDQAFRRKESKVKIHIGKFENIADKKFYVILIISWNICCICNILYICVGLLP